MFGVVRPCRHGMCQTLFKDWMAHLCGLCLALRAEHGQSSRLVTNYDGLLVSVLVEAQRAERSPHRKAGPCVLRGMKTADVVAAKAEGARLAAAVSLLLAAGKTRDHVADRDGAYARRLVAVGAGRMADRWDAAGGRTSADLGFDATVLREAVERQTRLEAMQGLGLLDLTEPTETAVAAAFAHTAVLAGKPQNEETLAEAGRFFGRIAHLIDAVEDLPADRAAGAYNPLLATGTDLAEARRHCDAALHGLKLAIADLDLENANLVKALLVREVRRSVQRAFAPYGLAGRPGDQCSLPQASYGGPPQGQQWGPPPGGPYNPGGGYGPGQGPGGYGPGGYGPGGYGPGGPGGPYGQLPFPPPQPPRPPWGLVCLAGTATFCTCGLFQPPWGGYAGRGCCDRCWCTRHCGEGCDCCDCCEGCGCCCEGLECCGDCGSCDC